MTEPKAFAVHESGQLFHATTAELQIMRGRLADLERCGSANIED